MDALRASIKGGQRTPAEKPAKAAVGAVAEEMRNSWTSDEDERLRKPAEAGV